MTRFLTILVFVPMLTFAQSYPGKVDTEFPSAQPPNDPPTWSGTPTPQFIEGIPSSHDFTQYFSDPEDDPITLSEWIGCTLPTGVSINDTTDSLDATSAVVEGETEDCVFRIEDGENDPVDSDPFTISVIVLPASQTVFERDMFGVPRTGTPGGHEL